MNSSAYRDKSNVESCSSCTVKESKNCEQDDDRIDIKGEINLEPGVSCSYNKSVDEESSQQVNKEKSIEDPTKPGKVHATISVYKEQRESVSSYVP